MNPELKKKGKEPIDSQFSFYPPRKILRRMGLVNDQDGIYRRYQQEQGEWKLHLSNTKKFIIECLEKSKIHDVAILGSGWMLDIPVDFLAERFERVVYYDIRHPVFIQNKFKEQKNFHFVSIDLTGGLILKVYRMFTGRKKPSESELPNELILPKFQLPEPADFVVSVNMLNQLDIFIIDYIRRYVKMSGKTEQNLRKKIQETHLKLLPVGSSCLITDYEEVHLDDDDMIIGKYPLVHSTLPAGKYRKTWTWNFDTRKTYHQNHKTYMNVVAIKM